jgi:hypothetical protein
MRVKSAAESVAGSLFDVDVRGLLASCLTAFVSIIYLEQLRYKRVILWIEREREEKREETERERRERDKLLQDVFSAGDKEFQSLRTTWFPLQAPSAIRIIWNGKSSDRERI